jgi:hypothetical protein
MPAVLNANYCPNPRAALDTAGWTVQGPGGEVFSRVTLTGSDPQPQGFQCTLNSNTRIHMGSGSFVGDLPVVPGDVIHAWAWMRVTNQGTSTLANINLNIAYNDFHAVFGQGMSLTNTWQLRHVAWGTTDTTETMEAYIHGDGNGTVQWTGVLLTKNSPVPSTYFYVDGDMPNATWAGTAHNSVSTLRDTWALVTTGERGRPLVLTQTAGLVTVPNANDNAVREAFCSVNGPLKPS